MYRLGSFGCGGRSVITRVPAIALIAHTPYNNNNILYLRIIIRAARLGCNDVQDWLIKRFFFSFSEAARPFCSVPTKQRIATAIRSAMVRRRVTKTISKIRCAPT